MGCLVTITAFLLVVALGYLVDQQTMLSIGLGLVIGLFIHSMGKSR